MKSEFADLIKGKNSTQLNFWNKIKSYYVNNLIYYYMLYMLYIISNGEYIIYSVNR